MTLNIFTGGPRCLHHQYYKPLSISSMIRHQYLRSHWAMFANVQFAITRAEPPLWLPATALILGAGGMQVALVHDDQTVHFRRWRSAMTWASRSRLWPASR